MSAKTFQMSKDIVAKLAGEPVLHGDDLDMALHKIGQVGLEVVGVDEVSIWQFSPTGESMNCIASNSVAKRPSTVLKPIQSGKIQKYIAAMQEMDCLGVPDSKQNTEAAELARNFLVQEKVKASLHVPVYIKGAFHGVVHFNQLRTSREWTSADRLIAMQVTDLAADTIQRFEMMFIDSYTPSILPLLNTSLDNLLELLDLSMGVIRLDEIPIMRGHSPEAALEFDSRYRASPALSGHTLIVQDVHKTANELRPLKDALMNEGVQAFVVMPLQISREQIGHILVSSESVMDWRPEEIALIERSAQNITRIVDDIWKRQDDNRLSSLIQRFQAGSPSSNPMMIFDEAIQSVGRNASHLLETDLAFILLRNPAGAISCPWVSGLKIDTVNELITTDRDAIQRILRYSKMPVYFSDINKSIMPKSLQDRLSGERIRSVRIFPLVFDGPVLGTMVGFYKQAQLYTRNEQSVLTLFANTATLTLQNAWMNKQVEEGYLNLALALANAIDARESALADISQRSASLAEKTARALHRPDAEVEDIHRATLLHDIGKKDVPLAVLSKPGPLTDEEWELVRRTPEKGEKLIEQMPHLRNVAKIIRNFHEHYDGSGYPDRLKGDQIPMGAKVLAIADAYISMLDRRPYREPRAPQEALREIQRHSGTQFDPVVVSAFSSVLETTTIH